MQLPTAGDSRSAALSLVAYLSSYRRSGTGSQRRLTVNHSLRYAKRVAGRSLWDLFVHKFEKRSAIDLFILCSISYT
jgi:hypothetical protein